MHTPARTPSLTERNVAALVCVQNLLYIDRNELLFDAEHPLASGAFGSVFRASWPKPGPRALQWAQHHGKQLPSTVVIKRFNKNFNTHDHGDRAETGEIIWLHWPVYITAFMFRFSLPLRPTHRVGGTESLLPGQQMQRTHCAVLWCRQSSRWTSF